MEWFFDGLGTMLIGLFTGSAVGGLAGYRIGIKKTSHYKQKARDNANQIQIGGDHYVGQAGAKGGR